jgi:hypothetical protein
MIKLIKDIKWLLSIPESELKYFKWLSTTDGFKKAMK